MASITRHQEATAVMKKGPGGIVPFRVLVLARNAMGGELLASALGKERMRRVTTARFSEALTTLSRCLVDVVVIAWDLHNLYISGLELTREISKTFPDVRIVMVAEHTTNAAVIDAFRSGACGVVSREQPLSELFDCIVQVGKGHLWTSASDSRYLLELLRSIPTVNHTAEMYSTLTVREMQVVRFAAAGMTNREIAKELGLSDHTVKNYLFKAFEKLGVSSRVELQLSLVLGGQMTAQARIEEIKTSAGRI
jgi:two-component system, NarL family, nitrate/nitrite response regulator NarL